MESKSVEKIAPELLARIAALKEKLASLLKKTNNPNTMLIKCHGYLREIDQKYSVEEFDFAPGNIVIDKDQVMSICLGISKSPEKMEGQVLWFLSENDKEPHFVSGYVPAQIKRNYALVLAA